MSKRRKQPIGPLPDKPTPVLEADGRTYSKEVIGAVQSEQQAKEPWYKRLWYRVMNVEN